MRDGSQEHVKLLRFDFLLLRDDGSGIRIHPEWSHSKFNMYEVEPHSSPVRPPRNGLGQSDGRGTFKWYKSVGTQPIQGRFDGTKGAHLGPKWQLAQ